MIAWIARLSGASSWLAAFGYAYFAFVSSTRLATAAVRWAAALAGASVVYVLVMLAIAAFWQHDQAHAAICCAGGMAVAVMCAARVASAFLPAAHRRAGLWTCTALGVLYPVLLAASSEPGAPIHGMQALYVLASAVGGVSALWSLSPVHGGTVSRTARA